MTYDLVIRNGFVIDGSGLDGYRADVGIRGTHHPLEKVDITLQRQNEIFQTLTKNVKGKSFEEVANVLEGYKNPDASQPAASSIENQAGLPVASRVQEPRVLSRQTSFGSIASFFSAASESENKEEPKQEGSSPSPSS